MRFIGMRFADGLRGGCDARPRCASNANPARANNYVIACCHTNAQTQTNFSDHAGIDLNSHFNTGNTHTRSD